MKILYIDPWCYDGSNLYYYSTGLLDSLSANADVTAFVGCNFTTPKGANYRIVKSFFPKSNNMKSGKLRQIRRGLEYLATYLAVFRELRCQKYDIVHIEWPLFYLADSYLMKLIKRRCTLLSLKAHNVLPHSSGDKYIESFRKIYDNPDVILVHGEQMKRDFDKYFHEYVDKITIQKHGVYLNHNCRYRVEEINNEIRRKIESYHRIYLFMGRIDYDKGVDRLVKIWNEKMNDSKSLLVIAGKVNADYDFSETVNNINKHENIVFINGFVEDNLLNYLVEKSNLVILPYRDGSMSGVVFTVAEFSKPLLCTRFGVIEEYLPDNYPYIIDNEDSILSEIITEIDCRVPNDDLSKIGNDLKNHIMNNYQWDIIGKKLIQDTYKVLLNNNLEH